MSEDFSLLRFFYVSSFHFLPGLTYLVNFLHMSPLSATLYDYEICHCEPKGSWAFCLVSLNVLC